MNNLGSIIAVVLAMGFFNNSIAADDHAGQQHAGGKNEKHAHEAKPKYGGVVNVINDINYELVVKSDALILYVTDHGKPVSSKGALATLTLLSTTEKTEIKLAPAGENKLQASGTFKIERGTKVVGTVKMGGKVQNVRFTLE